MKRRKTRYGCPVEFALDLIGGKWKSVILARLKDGKLRYGELRALMPGLSDKMLTQRLRDLQDAGLVTQGTEGGRAFYVLTARGEGLRPVLQAIYDWGDATATADGVAVGPARTP